MINLIEILIASSEDIVEFRNKLLTLLITLEINHMRSVNIAAKVSNLTHHIYFKQSPLKIKLGFEKYETVFELVITLILTHHSPQNFINFCQFSNAKYHNNDKEGGEISLNFPINAKLQIDSNLILSLKEKMIVQSKMELMHQLAHKNQELHQLLEDLKKSSSLIQAEKMRALGVLTAGVAHELNNPMMGILNFIQYCVKKTPPEDKRYEALKDAEFETKRCIEIVSNLLTFSHLEKEGVDEFKEVNLATIVQRVIKILSYRLRQEKIQVKESIPNDIPYIMGHENRLQQVVLNLVANALDAMKQVEEKCLTLTLEHHQSHLVLSIIDTGEGMDEDTKQKIFEPFFTTKPTGSGTGLGLSVCNSVIKEHSGNITCNSNKNKGTQFELILPIRKDHE